MKQRSETVKVWCPYSLRDKGHSYRKVYTVAYKYLMCPPPSVLDGPAHAHRSLHMAAANGHLAIVDYLIQNGADVNATNLEKNTPLHWACLNGHLEVIKSLIMSGASVSALNSHEKTPVDEVVCRGKLEVVDAINAAVAQAELEGVTVS
ncbi:Ankyrin repeat-containing protein [Rhynchospora pubera]|uniref:Ankyrin repeat-containing protein n=1 Tax=Rhynchospora pubera TaxID=906938 RepID=A0AAV8D6X5_9POAL|nr:Ankyrin repeat-containing protein [Rhynchospora pubera]